MLSHGGPGRVQTSAQPHQQRHRVYFCTNIRHQCIQSDLPDSFTALFRSVSGKKARNKTPIKILKRLDGFYTDTKLFTNNVT